VKPTSADEVRRSLKATLLGIALGFVLLALARTTRDPDVRPERGRS
jgi:hypothetical protein